MKVTFNRSLQAMSGKLDDLVFRNHYGETIAMPYTRREDKPSEVQLRGRDRFREAQAYAASVLSDPLKRACYRKLGAARKCPPNSLLISNFLTPPEIDEVDLSGYHGRMGDTVRVLASDPIEVVRVTVVIRDAAGEMLESGPAERDHDVWIYRCTHAAPNERPRQIEFSAVNRAGAVGTRTMASG